MLLLFLLLLVLFGFILLSTFTKSSTHHHLLPLATFPHAMLLLDGNSEVMGEWYGGIVWLYCGCILSIYLYEEQTYCVGYPSAKCIFVAQLSAFCEEMVRFSRCRNRRVPMLWWAHEHFVHSLFVTCIFLNIAIVLFLYKQIGQVVYCLFNLEIKIMK